MSLQMDEFLLSNPRVRTFEQSNDPPRKRQRTSPPASTAGAEAAKTPVSSHLPDISSENNLLPSREHHPIPSALLALPREIRDEIYHHAWSNTIFGIWHEGWLVMIRYGMLTPTNITVTLPQWTHTSSQILQEAMHYLHRHATFTLLSREQNDQPETWLPTFGNPTLQRLSRDSAAGTLFPGIAISRSTCVQLARASKLEVSVEPVEGVCTVYAYEQREPTQRLLSLALGTPRPDGAGLRELKLTLAVVDFSQWPYAKMGIPEVGPLDFSVFDRIPRTVRRLCVDLYNYDCMGHLGADDGTCAAMERRVRRECEERMRAVMAELAREGGGRAEFMSEVRRGRFGLKIWGLEAVVVMRAGWVGR